MPEFASLTNILLLRIVTNGYYIEPNQSIIGYNDNVRDEQL